LQVDHIDGMPVRHAGIRVDTQVVEALVQEVDGLIRRVAPWQRGPMRQGTLSGVFKHDLARRSPLAAEAAFVNQAMVLTAKLHQVIEAGLAAFAPVLDVMRIDEMLARAARKTATIITDP
jgi:hypothetical protein